MASSRKREARSAPTRKPILPKPKPSTKPAKRTPINGVPADNALQHYVMGLGVDLLDEAHYLLTKCMPHLGGDDKGRADRLRINISVHLREIADIIGDAPDGTQPLSNFVKTEGGAA